MKPVIFLPLLVALALLQYACSSFEDQSFSFERENRVVNVTDGKTTIRVAVITGDIVRVDYLEGKVNTFQRDTSWFVTKKPVNARFRIRQTSEELLIHTNRLVVEVTKEPFAAHFLDTEGNPLLTSTRRVQFDSTTTRAWFEATPGDRFYGMGQKSIDVNRRGYSFPSSNRHIGGYPSPGSTMQVNIPYVYSPRGWGVLFDNPWTGYFDMAHSNPDEWFYRTDGGAYSFFVLHRDTPQGLLRGYYDLTGYSPMFPKWTLGLLQGKYTTGKDSRTCRTLSTFRGKDLPQEAIILDANCLGGYREGNPDKHLFHLTRSATAGTQRYGTMVWSGDSSPTWDALKLQVPMLIGTAISGMPHFASGIGGFSNVLDRSNGQTNVTNLNRQDDTSPEMYTRWLQFGTFSPFLITCNGEEQNCEPFACDDQTGQIISRYLEYRCRLVPFLYSYIYKTAMTGEGLIRPMFFMFEQEEAYGKDYQYMFGKEMLVAPVLDEGAREAEVWLPELENNRGWINLHSGEKFEGGQTLEVSAPLDEIPVFVHQPSLFPLGKVKPHIGASPDDTLTLMVYPGGKAIFDLYEDDGTSNDYRKGKFAVTSLRTTTNGDELKIRINAANGQFDQMLQKRYWIINVHLLSDFDQLLLNNKEVTTDHYSYDQETQILTFSTWHPVKETLKLTLTNPSVR